MTIQDILKNRASLRDGIKADMQKLLTGWGMWMETIEISDVTICSSALFGNLQAEFKQQHRLTAFHLTNEADIEIEERRLKSDS